MSEPKPIVGASSGDPAVRALLSSHPRVESVSDGTSLGVEYAVGEWRRSVAIGDPSAELYGLVEIMDNNPLVCADRMSVPGPGATLALIALAPLAQAGLIAESPVVVLNFEADEAEIDKALASVDWHEGSAVHVEPVDLDGVLACTVMVSIRTPEELDDIDALYAERFDRSFYVRRDEESGWNPELVRGLPHAVFRLRISVDQPQSLLTVLVMADANGKCGAAQVVHAMNVMCGFEETLGIS